MVKGGPKNKTLASFKPKKLKFRPMSLRVQDLKQLKLNEVIDELKRRHVVLPKSHKKDDATLRKQLKEIVTEEVRRENEDPDIVEEDVIIRIQEHRKCKVSQFSQIFDAYAG